MTSFEAPAQHITRFDTAPMVLPPQAEASAYEPAALQANRVNNASKWRKRIAVVGALVVGAFGVEAATDAVASQAADVGCYGDYCSGRYAPDTGCDNDARTIASEIITQNKFNYSLALSSTPGVNIGSGADQPVGKLEVRKSDRCGTVWTRLNTKSGARVSPQGINSISIQQDGGYTQSRHIGGELNGSPPAVSFTPMVYGRNRDYRAFVKSRNFNVPSSAGTYWVSA